jgi:hypothetical protein
MRGWLGPDVLRGRGKSIGGGLDVDDEGSEQNVGFLSNLIFVHQFEVEVVLDSELDSKSNSGILNWIRSPS